MTDRIVQQRNNDCSNACIAMLTEHTLEETYEKWGSPCWGNTFIRDILEQHYETVETWANIEMDQLEPMVRREYFDGAYVVAESPISEYDEETYWNVAAKDGTTDLKHAVALVGTDLLDPSPNQYWESMYDLRTSPYELCHAYALHE